MRRVGQTRRRDANERNIIVALEQIGVIVLPVSGPGCPDLLCYCPREARWLPIEVKGPSGKLTRAQVNVRRVAAYPVVRSVEEALALFGVMYAGKYRPIGAVR
jgi:Holliday junction resolvase